MNIINQQEDLMFENKDVNISSCLSNKIILINCSNVKIYDINSEFVFISGCENCEILSSKIDHLFINDTAKFHHYNLIGEITKYSVVNDKLLLKRNNNFSFHF